jgi:hypothetical protein
MVYCPDERESSLRSPKRSLMIQALYRGIPGHAWALDCEPQTATQAPTCTTLHMAQSYSLRDERAGMLIMRALTQHLLPLILFLMPAHVRVVSRTVESYRQMMIGLHWTRLPCPSRRPTWCCKVNPARSDQLRRRSLCCAVAQEVADVHKAPPGALWCDQQRAVAIHGEH